jgi:hypothetical protein
MAIAGRKCLVKVSGTPLAFTDEATTANGTYDVYTITNSAKAVWDPTAPITVKKNGSTVSSGYTLDRLFGKVKFTSPLLPTDTVTVSGSYLPMGTLVEAYELSFGMKAENLDVSRFGDDWVRREQGILDASGRFSQWVLTNNNLFDEFDAGNPIVVEYWINNAVHFRAWALINAESLSAELRGVQSDEVQWEGTRDNDGRVISFG